MKIGTILIWVSIAFNSRYVTHYSDSDNGVQAYEIIDLIFKSQINKDRVKLLITPLSMERVDKQVLMNLVQLEKIKMSDIDFIMSKKKVASRLPWDASRLKNVKIIRNANKKKFKKNTYGVSYPIYSSDSNIAIIYVRYFGSDMMHEEVLVFELKDGSWNFLTSIFSLIS